MPDLRDFLHQTFKKMGGEIPFENFMALALYDPQFGYYSTAIKDVGGPRGDFSTSATLSASLGRGIAKWVQEEKGHHEWEGPLHIIEVGAGNGALAGEVLRSIGWWKRRQVHYHIVDVSAPLREKQKAALKPYRVSWHGKMEEALEAAEGKALIFSNELVDAFPAKWMVWCEIEGHWHEVFVRFDREKGLSEVLRPLPKFFPEDAYSALELRDRPQGQRVEIQPLFQRWLGNLSEHWVEGSMLTVDYGGKVDEIYHRRPEGTLRGYYRQQRFEGGDIYQRVGKQDLTVDVNFTDLVAWGEDFDFTTVSEESQAEFLSRYSETSDAMAGSGPGEAFRVLVQRR